jgi:hypothetical protein
VMDGIVLFIQKYTSGYRTFKGRYKFPNLWYRGVLMAEISDKQIVVSILGANIWSASLSDISSIRVRPEFTGASVIVTTHDGEGFNFTVDDTQKFFDGIKAFNLPLDYDKKTLQAEAKRYQVVAGPIGTSVKLIFLFSFILLFIVLPLYLTFRK